MADDPKDGNQQDSRRYSRNIDDTYVFDPATGIYKPKTAQTDEQRARQQAGANTGTPFFTHPRTDWWPVIVASLISVGTLILLGFTVHYARQQYREMKRSADAANSTLCEIQKQTKLMRQQIVGTQAALLVLQNVGIDASGKLGSQLQNIGHVNAIKIHFSAIVTKEAISDLHPIAKPITFDAPDIPPIAPQKTWDPDHWVLPWIPHELEQLRGFPAGWPGKETFEVHESLSYEDGFEDPQEQTFCFRWLPRYDIVTKTGLITGGGGLYHCDEFREAITNGLLQEKRDDVNRQN